MSRAHAREAINVDALRIAARRKVPRAVFDYVDGGAEDELTMGLNIAGWRSHLFRPKALSDIADRDTSTEIFGEKIDLPVILGPTGLTRLISPRQGEVGAARAAASHGALYVASTAASLPIEEIRAATSAPMWFQLYLWNNRDESERLIARAAASGFSAMCITVDTAVRGNRERDLRNGFTYPPKLTWRMIRDGVTHPRWTWDLIATPRIGMANLAAGNQSDNTRRTSAAAFLTKRIVDPKGTTTWADLAWVRDLWKGPLLLKGILRPEDAAIAIDRGFDGVIVSNHGGRQLDGLPSTASVLADVVDRIGDLGVVLVDGGIRRGSDVVRAIALGAKACLIGRPYLYGLAADGERGVGRVIEILKTELDRTMALLGVAEISEIDRSLLADGA